MMSFQRFPCKLYPQSASMSPVGDALIAARLYFTTSRRIRLRAATKGCLRVFTRRSVALTSRSFSSSSGHIQATLSIRSSKRSSSERLFNGLARNRRHHPSSSTQNEPVGCPFERCSSQTTMSGTGLYIVAKCMRADCPVRRALNRNHHLYGSRFLSTSHSIETSSSHFGSSQLEGCSVVFTWIPCFAVFVSVRGHERPRTDAHHPFNDASGTRRTRGSTRSRSEAMTSSMSL